MIRLYYCKLNKQIVERKQELWYEFSIFRGISRHIGYRNIRASMIFMGYL